ncbi:UNVERIFIED_CONTAM: hypothetical protein ABIC26_001945 [Paenibacillus sp. PvR008]
MGYPLTLSELFLSKFGFFTPKSETATTNFQRGVR